MAARPSRRRRLAWSALALVLVGLAAWLMARGDGPLRRRKVDRVAFPRYQDDEAGERTARRKTLVRPVRRAPAPDGDGGADADDVVMERYDPLLLALPQTPGKTTIVLEAAALRDTPIGRYLVDCLLSGGQRGDLERLRRALGADPLEAVERLGFSDGVAVVEGRFGGADWASLADGVLAAPYGARSRVLARPDVEGGGQVGVYDDRVLVLGRTHEDLEQALDRLEGEAPPAAPVIPDWAMYGEVYGVVGQDVLEDLVGRQDEALAARMRETVSRVMLHVDAADDVAIVADVEGDDPEATRDLAKTLGAALSVARLQAKAEANEDLSELLDYAAVAPRDGRFSMDLALPMDLVRRRLGPCPAPASPP